MCVCVVALTACHGGYHSLLSNCWQVLCRVDDSNTMSVTMLLRRSPDLNVATLEGMNLVSSTTLSQPITPPSRAQSPQHAMSNDTFTDPPEHMPLRALPKARNPVVPHIILLRDLQADALHGEQGSEVEGKSRSWHSAQHAGSPSTMQAQSRSSPSAEEAAFDLYHHSQMPAVMKQETGHSSPPTESAAPGQGRPLPCSRASSISPAGGLTTGGAYSIQGPALDTDALGTEAVGAAAASDGAQGSCSPQPSALGSQLSGRSSTVRFMFETSNPLQDPSRASTAAIAEDDAEHARHAVLQSQHSDDAVPREADRMWDSDKRTWSLSSTASSLKGVLKKTASKDSAVTLPCDSGQAWSSHGISFALGAGNEDSSNEDAISSMQSSALLKQGSESFPSWLTGG